MAVSIPRCVVKSNKLSLDDDPIGEDFSHEALAFFGHSSILELDEDVMKPEKATEVQETQEQI